jgi:hypothetical protein
MLSGPAWRAGGLGPCRQFKRCGPPLDSTRSWGQDERGSIGLPGSPENDFILAAVDAARLPALLEKLRPILGRWGGVCLVSDAQWLKHGPEESVP